MDKPSYSFSDFFLLLLYIDVVGNIPVELIGAAYAYSFANIPIRGFRRFLKYIHSLFVSTSTLAVLFAVCGVSMGTFVVPLYSFLVLVILCLITIRIYQNNCKFMKVKDPRNGEIVRLDLGAYLAILRELLMNEKVKAVYERLVSTAIVTVLFA